MSRWWKSQRLSKRSTNASTPARFCGGSLSLKLNHSPKSEAGCRSIKGFTLIELLVAIALTSFIAAAMAVIFDAAMTAWRFGEEIAEVEAVVPDFMNRMSEGDYRSAGIVDALTVTHADKTSVSFVPLIVERLKPDPFVNKEQIFDLSRPFQTGAPLPNGQVRPPEERVFESVRTEFRLGKDEDPPQEKDRIRFLDEIPPNSEVRVVYRPDYTKMPGTVMTIRWDFESKSIVREYEGDKVNLSENSFGVQMTDMELQYFSNVNAQVVASAPDGVLTDSERQIVTAVKLIVTVQRGDTKKVFTQFINMRNLGWATSGVVVKEGSELKIPNSKNIRSLSVVNVFGIKEKSDLRLVIESAYGKTWAVTLTYDLIDEKPMLVRYQVEYPGGKTVLERIVAQPASQSFSLLTLDEQGKFNYRNEEGVENAVDFDEEEVTLHVDTMEVGGAAIHVRP